MARPERHVESVLAPPRCSAAAWAVGRVRHTSVGMRKLRWCGGGVVHRPHVLRHDGHGQPGPQSTGVGPVCRLSPSGVVCERVVAWGVLEGASSGLCNTKAGPAMADQCYMWRGRPASWRRAGPENAQSVHTLCQ